MRQFVAAGRIPRSAKVFACPSDGHLPRYEVDTKDYNLLSFRFQTWAKARGGGIRNAAVVDRGGFRGRTLYYYTFSRFARSGKGLAPRLSHPAPPRSKPRDPRVGP